MRRKMRVSVKVFRPNYRFEGENFVLYPMIAYSLRLKFKRIGMRDKLMEYFAYVDCIRAGVERGDSILPVEEWEVDEKRIMKPLIGEDEAEEIALNAAKSWGNLMVVSWWNPKVEIVNRVKAYKVFWLNGDYIVDSLTGEKVKVRFDE